MLVEDLNACSDKTARSHEMHPIDILVQRLFKMNMRKPPQQEVTRPKKVKTKVLLRSMKDSKSHILIHVDIIMPRVSVISASLVVVVVARDQDRHFESDSVGSL